MQTISLSDRGFDEWIKLPSFSKRIFNIVCLLKTVAIDFKCHCFPEGLIKNPSNTSSLVPAMTCLRISAKALPDLIRTNVPDITWPRQTTNTEICNHSGLFSNRLTLFQTWRLNCCSKKVIITAETLTSTYSGFKSWLILSKLIPYLTSSLQRHIDKSHKFDLIANGAHRNKLKLIEIKMHNNCMTHITSNKLFCSDLRVINDQNIHTDRIWKWPHMVEWCCLIGAYLILQTIRALPMSYVKHNRYFFLSGNTSTGAFMNA